MCVSGLPSGSALGKEASDRHPSDRLTLRPDQRINDPVVFRDILTSVPAVVGRLMVLRIREGDGRRPRIGLITSKRTFRRAVDRSRARRLMREAFRRAQHELEAGSDLVVIGRQAILQEKAQAVYREMLRLIEKARRRSSGGRGA